MTHNAHTWVSGEVIAAGPLNSIENDLATVSTANTGDQTLSIAGTSLTISGANGNTVTIPTGGGGGGTVTSAGITDATTVGKAVLTAADAPSARTAIGALASTDASVTNSRTPTAHASTHASGGSDPVTIAASQVTGLGTAATQPSSAFDAAGAAAAVLPTQTGNSGKFLTTNGTAVSWGTPAGGTGSSAVLQQRSALPSGVFAETFTRGVTGFAGVTLTSGQPRLTAIPLFAGEVVSAITFVTGGSTETGTTHSWAALCDSGGTVVAISADDTVGTWPSSSAKKFTLASPYTVPTSGVYYTVLCVVASTLPAPMGLTGNSNVAALTPTIAATAPVNTGTPPTVGASIGTFANVAVSLYAALS